MVLNNQLGGVNVQIVEASQVDDTEDVASFLSSMRVNISALAAARVTNVSCGSFSVRSSINITLDSNRGIAVCILLYYDC